MRTVQERPAWPGLIERYRDRLPVGPATPVVTLHEGGTPLVPAPRLAEAHYWLGNAYGNRLGDVGMFGKLKLAPKLRDAFVRTIELDPDYIKARSNLIEFYLQAPDMLGGGVDKARAQAREIGAAKLPPLGDHGQGIGPL